jgi:ArsR family transcriptional regulator
MRKAVKIFKALSDPTRLRILMLLLEHELCVCELMFILNMEQSRISHQLRILRDAEVVQDLRQGKWIIYRIATAIRNELKALLEEPFAGDLRRGKEIEKDKENLKICLQKQIRKHGFFLNRESETDER